MKAHQLGLRHITGVITVHYQKIIARNFHVNFSLTLKENHYTRR
jgi:hypothetical protein